MNRFHLVLLLIVATGASSCILLHAQTKAGPEPCHSTVTGKLDILPLTSKVYGNERNLRIWLPPGYSDAENAKVTYPVLYMFDGTWLFDQCTAPGTQGEWKVDETLTELISKHEVEPIIVVGIDSNSHRDAEYAPYGNPFAFSGPLKIVYRHLPPQCHLQHLLQ